MEKVRFAAAVAGLCSRALAAVKAPMNSVNAIGASSMDSGFKFKLDLSWELARKRRRRARAPQAVRT